MTDRIGQQLGNYRLSRLLGGGGFAEVYLGEHVELGTMVAIKILRTRVAEEDVTHFRQEARLLASLRHPQIVRVLDFGVDEEIPYLVMDYAPNGTLRTRHARGTPLPISTVVGYVKQIAQALQYAHDGKIVHRDVKPENMLIGEHNEILLSDFGIALIAQSSRNQSTQDVIGTVAYMSPEQIQGKPRPASDQYSLGIAVYEWLNGMCPFRGSFTELCTQHMFASPPPLREKMPTISPDVEHVVTTALAKDPKQRFGSMRAFATALEQASQAPLPTQQSRPLSISSPLYIPAPPASMPLPLPATVPTPQPQRPVESSITNTTQSDRLTPLPASVLHIPTPPDLRTPTKMIDKPTVSRRTVLIGAGATAAIVAVGTGIFAILQQHPQSQVVRLSDQTVTPQTPTIIPQVPTVTPFTCRGHSDSVYAVAWSPDGKWIASGSGDKTVQVWNAKDGSNVFTYRGHSARVWGVAWSPDGKWIASGSGDKTVQVWNATDGSKVSAYQWHSNEVNTVAWSPDGKRIASGSDDKTVQVWNAKDGSKVFTCTGHSDTVWSVAWSLDGKRITSGSRDKTVQVWNAKDGSKVFTYIEHSNTVWSVAWSPDGKWIASGSDDKTVQVWNASNGSNVFTYRGRSNEVNTVAWSPDGKRIASGSDDKTVQVWNATDGSNGFTYQGHSDRVWGVTWSPDGKWMASGSDDKTVQVWHVG